MDILKEIFDWYNNFNGRKVVIKSENKEFYINIEKESLPHLLGLHYMEYNKKISPRKVLENIANGQLGYSDVLKNVKNRNKSSLKNVKDRISTFKSFMENIDSARIVEFTKTDKSKMHSQFLVIDDSNGKTKHLGILETGALDYILDYDINAFETYFIDKKGKYYENTKIDEPVIELLFYEDSINSFRAGSFNIQKDEILKNAYKSTFKEKYSSILSKLDLSSKIQHNNFSFLPMREFTDIEKNMGLKEISSYLITDSFKDINEFSAENFLSEIDSKCDLFYNIETGNVYIPAEFGMFKYDIKDDEIINLLENKYSQIQVNKLKKQEFLHELQKLQNEDYKEYFKVFIKAEYELTDEQAERIYEAYINDKNMHILSDKLDELCMNEVYPQLELNKENESMSLSDFKNRDDELEI